MAVGYTARKVLVLLLSLSNITHKVLGPPKLKHAHIEALNYGVVFFMPILCSLITRTSL